MFWKNMNFQLMALSFKLHDWFQPRDEVLRGIDIQSGDNVLDYGCGPGSYIIPLYERVGRKGEIFALDMHPLAVKK